MLRKAVATLKKTGPLVEKSASAMPRVQVLLINKRILIHNRKRRELDCQERSVESTSKQEQRLIYVCTVAHMRSQKQMV